MTSHRASVTVPKIAWYTARSGPLVWSAPIISVDSIRITAMPSTTGNHALIQYQAPARLLNMIVGRLAGDDHVMHVAFAQARPRNAHELRVLLQFLHGSAAQVTHARPPSAHQLKHHRLQRSTIGYASLDSFRHKLGQPVLARPLALYHALGAELRAGEVFSALEIPFS